MPQMSPLSWSILFLFFICMFMFYNMMIYWEDNSDMDATEEISTPMKINWKW
uniref:ATPase subunit 8 n=1 Tax=Piesma cf. maculatum TaxID=2931304 RepID=A0A8T9ZWN3_9HEMI|nr:ATPase subunit 8 [Piesma cf. maculatum]